MKSTKKGLKVRSSAPFAIPSPFSLDRPMASVTHVVIESGTSNRSSASPVSALSVTQASFDYFSANSTCVNINSCANSKMDRCEGRSGADSICFFQ